MYKVKKSEILNTGYASDQRFRTLFEEAPLSIQIFTLNGETVGVNKAWEKLWNTTFEKLGSYNILKDKQLEEAGIMPLIKRGFKGEALSLPPIKYEPSKTVNIPGVVSYRWTGAFIYPVKDAYGKTKEVVLIHQDITEQKEFEIELAKSKEHLNELVSNVPGVVWEIYNKPDSKLQKIDFVSKYAEKMLGYTEKEWLETPNFWLKIVHPDDKVRAKKEFSFIFKSGDGGISRFRWVKKNGDVIWVEAQSKVIKDEKGTSVGMRGVTMDITERNDIEERKDEFISIASHELKTPLTSLKIYTKLLEDCLPPDAGRNVRIFLHKMDSQLNRLNKLISELLNVSLIQKDQLRFRKKYFSLENLLKENIKNSLKNIRERNIILKGSVKRKVWGDSQYIDEVVGNLLSNALKYSPKGDNVIVEVKSREDDIVVSVEDHGFGIEKKYQDKVFNRFYRVYDKKDKTFPGMGMGLYISKEIIKRHGGAMWMESEKGKGSKFYFSLPYYEKN